MFAAAPPDGYVVRIESATVYLDWGKPSGVQPGDRFQLYRPGEALKHPVSGELLGSAEETLGTGAVQTVEEKFAIGRLDPLKTTPRAGDRTKWLSGAAPSLETPPSAPAASLASQGPAPVEIWRSAPLEKDAAGLAFSDLDKDGKKEIILAYRTKILAYRLKDKALEPMASFDSKKFGRWLAIEAADLQGTGQEDIFATAFQGGLDRPRVVVLRFENGELKKVAEFEGFVRAVERVDGRRPLLWQSMSRARDLSFTGVSELEWSKEKESYRPGRSLDLKLFNDQLFGFAWGSWYAAGQDNFAVLEHGERIRLYAPDVKWKSSEIYGGTKNDFTLGDTSVGSIAPRLFRRSIPGDKDQLLVPTNFPDFGIRFTHLKIYKRSEIAGLAWNGLEMKPVWKIPIQGYLADYGMVDLLGESQPQLWAAAVGPGNKTILLSYRLP